MVTKFPVFVVLCSVLVACGKNQISHSHISECDSIPHGDYLLTPRLSCLHEMKAQRKILTLVIGRMSGEPDHPPLIDSELNTWIYGDRLLLHQHGPHDLIMDFSETESLTKIADHTFDRIIFDVSVWKFFSRSLETIAPQYNRILKNGGRLFFDQNPNGANGIRTDGVNSINYFFHKNHYAVTSFLYPSNFMALIGANGLEKTKSDLNAEAFAEIQRRYDIYFKSIGFRELIAHPNGSDYPILNAHMPMGPYFEVVN